jgi:CubicO group peptidase (beta-lactamase class C family)
VTLALLLAAILGTAAPGGGLAHALDSLLTATYRPDQPGAAVIVVKDGRVVHRAGYGLAQLELGVPIRPEMVFRIGSITKQFTAVAILMLAEEGRLGLSDSLTRFLPDYPTQGKRITIEHLLTHTSGIKNYTELSDYRARMRRDVTPTELIAEFKDQLMEFPPGERWKYDNSGYVLLGAVIERVSGMPYADFLRTRIFEPLGMRHTCYDDARRVLPGRVSGYVASGDTFQNSEFLSMSQPYAAGALVSSVDDLALWDAALESGRPVSRKWLDRAWTEAVLADGHPTGYGFGWEIGTHQGHRLVQHNGGISGFRSEVLSLPDDHVFVAVLANNQISATRPEDIALQLASLAAGLPERPPVAIALTAEALAAYEGEYQLAPTFSIRIFHEGEHLMEQATGQSALEIFPRSPSLFFIKAVNAEIEFTLDHAGKATGLILHQNGHDIPGRRLP